MAATECTSFESQDALFDGLTLVGSAAYSTVQARTGVASMRCNPASGASGYWQGSALTNAFNHFGLYVATMPTAARMIAGTNGAGADNLLLNTDGTISVCISTTVVGTSTVALVTGQWYWIGHHTTSTTPTTGVLLQINGVDQVSGTSGTLSATQLGCTGTEASAIDLYFDDCIEENATFLAPSKVALLVPISDNSVGTGWTNDAAGTTNLWDALNNKPPVGIADTTTGSGLHQIRNAAANLNAYAANLTTYATAGIATGDTIVFLEPNCMTGAPVATSAKAGSLTLSNPTMAKTSFGGTAKFYSGANAGTYPTGWQFQAPFGPLASPTVTLSSSPVITVTQDTSSTRIAMVCLAAVRVAWTPAVVANPPYVNPMPQFLAQ